METDYLFFGMHIGWWIAWLVLLFWIFVTPYDIPFQRKSRSSPLDILKKRYAAGKITSEEYKASRKVFRETEINA